MLRAYCLKVFRKQPIDIQVIKILKHYGSEISLLSLQKPNIGTYPEPAQSSSLSKLTQRRPIA
jgi:hypothetical protein